MRAQIAFGQRKRGIGEGIQRKKTKTKTNRELISSDEIREKIWEIEGQDRINELGGSNKSENQEIEGESAIDLLVKEKDNQGSGGCESKDQSTEKVKEEK